MSLDAFMRAGNRLPQQAILSLVRQCAVALDAAGHSRRSPTPADITVSNVAADGGIEAEIKELASERILDESPSLGMPNPEFAAYLSPEEILGGEPNARSDQFVLAVIAYELLCGRRPFSGGNLSLLFYEVCANPPVPASQANPALPAAVDAVLGRALAKMPDERYQTSTEFAEALASAFEPPAAPPIVPSGHETPIVEPEPSPAREPEPPPQAPAAFALVPPQPARFESVPESAPLVPPAVPYELPPARRRNRWGDDDDRRPVRRPATEPPDSRARGSKKWIVALAVFAIGVVLAFIRWQSGPKVPVQVANPNMGPAAPPPSEELEGNEREGIDTTPPTASQRPATVSRAPVVPSSRQAPKATSPKANLSESRPVQKETPRQEPARQRVLTAQAPRTERLPAATPTPPNYGSGTVDFVTSPPGARITIDGSILCTAPCTLTLPPGRHVLSAYMRGYALADRIFHVPEDNSLIVELAQGVGVVMVNSIPAGATVTVDGRSVGRAPLSLHIPAGPHRIALSNGPEVRQQVINVQPDTIQGVTLDLQ